MLSLLKGIWCVIVHLPCYLLYGGIAVINAIILALGTVAQAVVAGIPIDMPDPPELDGPFTDALHWVAWVFPVGTVLDILTFFLGAWLMWQVVAIALRWIKATDG